ncbi:MAG: DUF6599 family protein [Bacteroidota bacterium]
MNCNKLITFVCVLIGSSNFLLAQLGNDFPKLSESDLPGSKITREQVFDGSSLWGYINGGADIFLEYGFDKLLLQEITFEQYKIKIEFYRMNDINSAFGIYSVSHYKCSERDSSIKHNCITPYQIQTAIGPYYISVINKNGSRKEQSISKMIWDKLISKISKEEFIPPPFFINKELTPHLIKMKYINGKLGLQNGFYNWYDRFENLSDYEIFLLPFETGDTTINISQINFASEIDADIFLNNLSITVQPGSPYSKKEEKAVSYIVKMLSHNKIIFIESNLSVQGLENAVKKLF